MVAEDLFPDFLDKTAFKLFSHPVPFPLLFRTGMGRLIGIQGIRPGGMNPKVNTLFPILFLIF